jgi:hypothetical protein
MAGRTINLEQGGQLIVLPNPVRPEVIVTALSRDMRSAVTLVLTDEERDELMDAVQREEPLRPVKRGGS